MGDKQEPTESSQQKGHRVKGYTNWHGVDISARCGSKRHQTNPVLGSDF